MRFTDNPPRTIMEVFKILPEGTLAELIDGSMPDMLLEILSPGNPQHDLVRRKSLYEKFCVKEYWIINPDTKETSGFLLKDGKYSDAFQSLAK